MLGFLVVPDNVAYIVTFFSERIPTSGKKSHLGPLPGIASEVALQGLHWYLPFGHQVENAIPLEPQEVFLFRHEDDRPADYAEIELRDVTVTLKVKVIARIKRENSEPSCEAIRAAHYESTNSDFLRQTEIILNPRVRSVFQGKYYDIAEETVSHLPNYQDRIEEGDVNFVGVSNLKPDKFLELLGLRYCEGQSSPLESTTPQGAKIISLLAEIGVELLDITIGDINLPDEVDQARQQRIVARAQSEAAVEAEEIRASLVAAQVANLQAQRQGEAEALRIQTEGFIQAVTQAASRSNDQIDADTLVEIFGRYPALEKVIGNKAQFYFQGGGGVNPLVQGMTAALNSQPNAE